MRKLSSFTFLSLNGCYKRMNEDINWHQHGAEEAAFSAQSLKSGNTLLFGRKTFQMMESFWPTPIAAASFPEVANGMNAAEKIVCSSTLNSSTWTNTRFINGNSVDEVRKLKNSSGNNITILGSGVLQSLLTSKGLIDEYTIMIDPVIIEQGVPFLQQITGMQKLTLKESRAFSSGVVLLSYQTQP